MTERGFFVAKVEVLVADHIAHNFEPWLEIVLLENSFDQNVITDHLGNSVWLIIM